MSIQMGERIPEAIVTVSGDGMEPISTSDFFAGAKVLLFAVPGAFTPTCSNQHLPGYIEHMDAFRARDIKVACLAVNDAFVMRAWADAHSVPPDLVMLADGNAVFVAALGLQMDGSAFGMGPRARRFALYAEDGVVRLLALEAPGEYRVSSAEAVLQALDTSL